MFRLWRRPEAAAHGHFSLGLGLGARAIERAAFGSWPVQVAGGTPIPIYVAAMGPKALQVNGELAGGTTPYLAGPKTIGEFIVPTISKAAAEAGRSYCPRMSRMRGRRPRNS